MLPVWLTLPAAAKLTRAQECSVADHSVHTGSASVSSQFVCVNPLFVSKRCVEVLDRFQEWSCVSWSASDLWFRV